ncbi:SurA N-terminal domain-containing protein [Candidatus Woesearchaeota archaeon]|nr:SurA N-terminal domain-containing protein [Candidatus Woesearchaeota archaeon]
MRKQGIISVLLLMVVFAGCASTQRSDQDLPTSPNTTTVTPVGAVLNQTIVAYVNSEPITQADFDVMSKRGEGQYANNPDELPTHSFFLNASIIETLLYQQAIKKGFNASEADVNADISSKVNEGAFEFLLKVSAANSLTVGELRESFQREITISQFLNATVLSKVSVNESEIEAYYQNFGSVII